MQRRIQKVQSGERRAWCAGGAGGETAEVAGALHAEKRWRLPEQSDPSGRVDEVTAGDSTWWSNYSSVRLFKEGVVEVLEDQASRQIPIDERDWHLHGCQVKDDSDFHVNRVGSPGVASASYGWSSVASALGRLAQYTAGTSVETSYLLVADGSHFEASGSGYRCNREADLLATEFWGNRARSTKHLKKSCKEVTTCGRKVCPEWRFSSCAEKRVVEKRSPIGDRFGGQKIK